MNESNLAIENQTCRWCSLYDDSKVGMKVCDCDGSCGYAHNKCFFNYVRQTAHRRCDYCKKGWFVDKQLWKQYISIHKRVTICNRVREAASILLTLLVLLSMIILWAETVKFTIWVIYASPNYVPFGVPTLASTGWFIVSVGDILIGSMATLVTIVLAVVWVHYKTKCFRCCCGKSRQSKQEYSQELNQIEPLYRQSSGRRAIDTLITSRHSSQNFKHTPSSVVLGQASDEDDDDLSYNDSSENSEEGSNHGSSVTPGGKVKDTIVLKMDSAAV